MIIIVIKKISYCILFISQPKIGCGYSKELFQLDSSFEHPKHVKLMDKKKKTFTLKKFVCGYAGKAALKTEVIKKIYAKLN